MVTYVANYQAIQLSLLSQNCFTMFCNVILKRKWNIIGKMNIRCATRNVLCLSGSERSHGFNRRECIMLMLRFLICCDKKMLVFKINWQIDLCRSGATWRRRPLSPFIHVMACRKATNRTNSVKFESKYNSKFNKIHSNKSSSKCRLFRSHILFIFRATANCISKILSPYVSISGCPDFVPIGHDDVIKWKHFPRYWPFVRGIHRSPVHSPLKGQWRGALMFSLICAWINGWVNNRDAGDLRWHRAHYNVIVMVSVHRVRGVFILKNMINRLRADFLKKLRSIFAFMSFSDTKMI